MLAASKLPFVSGLRELNNNYAVTGAASNVLRTQSHDLTDKTSPGLCTSQ